MVSLGVSKTVEPPWEEEGYPLSFWSAVSTDGHRQSFDEFVHGSVTGLTWASAGDRGECLLFCFAYACRGGDGADRKYLTPANETPTDIRPLRRK